MVLYSLKQLLAQYFGGGTPYGTFAALPKLLDTITQLDPQFEYPYEFALTVLPFTGGTSTAVTLGERAQTALPGNGLLTFYLASVYQINLKDYAASARLYQKAATEAGSPTAAQQLAGVSLARINNTLDDRLVALTFWKAAFDNAKNDDDRKRAKDWYEHLSIVYSLEQKIAEYKKQYGSFPRS